MSKVAAETIHGQGVTEVVFRRKGLVGNLIVLLLIACGWLAAGGLAAIISIGARDPLFTTVWFALWLVVGGGFVLMRMWRVFGSESLIAYPDRLVLQRRLLLARPQRSFPVGTVSAIRWLADDPLHVVRVNGRRIPQTSIEVLADGAELRVARGIGESEARGAIASLEQRLLIGRRRAAR